MEIKSSPAGKVIRALRGDYKAFVPHPLPPDILWSTVLVNSLSTADRAIGMLAREGSRLANPHLLIRPFIAREAVLSSKIEGTQATLGEMLAHEAGAAVERSPAELQEVHNYIVALDYGISRLQELPLSLCMIREIHEKLMSGARGSHAYPGEFRHTQNWIGTPGCTLQTAKYVPPPPEELLACLGDFEHFLYDRTIPPLIQVALCHYQFEAIHPFLDGNGRVGRLLIILLLIEQKILPAPLLYISAFFEVTRDEYYQRLYQVSNAGQWHEWLVYVLNGVSVQAHDLLSRAERINALIARWHQEAAGIAESTIHQIIRQLAINPYCTTTNMAQTIGAPFTSTQRAIKKLEKLHILAPVNERKRDRVYCAQQVLQILEEPIQLNRPAF